eukprot:scaffold6528_cov267-Chaetoceros_neogracile.AAC.12
MMRRAEGCFVPTPARVGDGRLCAKVPKTSQYPPINTLQYPGYDRYDMYQVSCRMYRISYYMKL